MKVFTLLVLCSSILLSPVFSVYAKSNVDSGGVFIPTTDGMFSFVVPPSWRKMTSRELKIFKKQYEKESLELFKQYYKRNDKFDSGVISLTGFLSPGHNATFVSLAMKIPPQTKNYLQDMFARSKEVIKWGKSQGRVKKIYRNELSTVNGVPALRSDLQMSDGSRIQTYGLYEKKYPEQVIQITLHYRPGSYSRYYRDGKRIMESFFLRGKKRSAIRSHKVGKTKAFLNAAIDGDDTLISSLLSQGVNVNVKDKSNNGKTALIIAARKGHSGIVKMLLSHGANVNAKDGDDLTSLMLSSQYGHAEIAHYLISKGAKVNAKDRRSAMALLHASHNGHVEIVKNLLRHGADVNAKDKEGWSALQNASLYGHAETVNVLIAKGADVNSNSNIGNSPLINASYKGHIKTVRYLIDGGADVNFKNEKGTTALSAAKYYKHLKIVEFLKKAGAKQRYPKKHPTGQHVKQIKNKPNHFKWLTTKSDLLFTWKQLKLKKPLNSDQLEELSSSAGIMSFGVNGSVSTFFDRIIYSRKGASVKHWDSIPTSHLYLAQPTDFESIVELTIKKGSQLPSISSNIVIGVGSTFEILKKNEPVTIASHTIRKGTLLVTPKGLELQSNSQILKK